MKTWKGVYTIEVALLMPIILSAVMAVIYAVFIFHDKNRMEIAANAIIIRSERILRHELLSENGKIDYDRINDGDVYAFISGNYNEKAKTCRDYLENNLNKGLFLLKAGQIDFKMDRGILKYRIEVKCMIGLPMVQRFINKGDAIIKKEIKYQDAPDFVRKTVALLGGNLGDKNKILE